MNQSHYKRLFLMAGLSGLSMYWLMYAMVDSTANIYNSLNQLYMAGLMTMPMIVLELVVMGSMYRNKRWNVALVAASAVAFALCWTSIREQVGISDKQFLRSMISHHAGAVLMCDEADIEDPDVKALCERIVSSQRSEIQDMKVKLAALGSRSR